MPGSDISLVELRLRFVQLVHSFPVLHTHAPGLYAADADLPLIDAWAAHDKDEAVIARIVEAGKGPFPGDGAVEAARFVLGVWDRLGAWKVGRFDVFRALDVWDAHQVEAFKAWASNPWHM